jgi:hypothetical protein
MGTGVAQVRSHCVGLVLAIRTHLPSSQPRHRCRWHVMVRWWTLARCACCLDTRNLFLCLELHRVFTLLMPGWSVLSHVTELSPWACATFFLYSVIFLFSFLIFCQAEIELLCSSNHFLFMTVLCLLAWGPSVTMFPIDILRSWLLCSNLSKLKFAYFIEGLLFFSKCQVTVLLQFFRPCSPLTWNDCVCRSVSEHSVWFSWSLCTVIKW